MDGQWFGQLSGTEGGGVVLLDLDDCGDHFRGSAFYFDNEAGLPGTYAEVVTSGKHPEQRLTLFLTPLDPTGKLLSPHEARAAYPDVEHSTSAYLHLKQDGAWMHVTYSTGEPTRLAGEGRLFRAQDDVPSIIPADPTVTSWDDFKAAVSGIRPRRHIFRGQPCLKRLRTSFHRTKRSDLVRYVREDITAIRKAVTPLTRHFYDLSDPNQTGAMYSLMQHHGYPTPFLDWSWSPFISAFFAYRNGSANDSDRVRVFMFDLEEWERRFPKRDSVTFVPPHISFNEFLNIENVRAGPQQAVCTATNMDDIELLFTFVENNQKVSLIRAFDLPLGDRQMVLDDLSMMGITAASLFPGLDGACEAVRGRMFGF